uniref:dipeptidyl peptidase 2 n=1 Tax=Ciona intestinalis TaxID=7719 RepID=UPI000180C1A1|nr:dipeptidyl peptidase 2 [Ciona intestinalis]|eukprot:XP_002127477.1 dipeptidyl peptidase 2 [Ciona intestinalis]
MKSLFCFTLLAFLLHATTATYHTKYFEQFVDHFNFQSNGNATYMQRYLISDEHWVAGKGPMLFYAGNEGDIVGFKDASGLLTETAPKLGAMVVFAEHRFYGTSLPFGNDSFIDKNIGLLSIEQAMADYAYLLKHLKSSYNADDIPIIAFGGSYGGILAAYMRIKYPNLITGALAASAPIYWTSGEGNPHGFWKSVTTIFGHNEGCVNRVKEGFAETAKYAQQGKYDVISKGFKTCSQVKSSSLMHLYGWVRNSFTQLAMANYPYPANFFGPLPAFPVNVACEKMLKANTAIEGMLEATSLLYNGTGDKDCFDIYEEYIECSDPTGCSLGLAARSWDYQGCTEIVLPGGSTNITDMFPAIPFTPEIRKKYCETHQRVTPRRNWLALNFWTDNLKLSSNIIFSNGDLDPWKDGGILHDLSPTVVALLVKGGAHHLDLRGSNPQDPPSVIEVRKHEVEIISGWIAQHWEKILGNTGQFKKFSKKQTASAVRKIRWNN